MQGRPPSLAPNGPGWKVRVVPNRFPALKIEGDLDRKAEGIYDLMNGIGAHEVVIETDQHEQQLKDLSDQEVTEVLFAFKARILDLRNDQRFRYILLFKNQGQQAGASMDHAHSQLIALPVTPRQVQDEIDGARRHFEHRERCIFCDVVAQERKDRARLVFENEEFVVFTPWAPRSPFETWVVPKRHESNFEAEPKERLGLCAQALRVHAAPALGRAGRSALQLHPPLQPAARRPQPELPLAHRGDAGAHPGGRLRVGLGLPHQPGPARGGRRVPPQGRRLAAWSCSSSPRRWRRSPRPAGSGTCWARCRRRWPRPATRWRWSPRATASSTPRGAASARRDRAVRVRGEATTVWWRARGRLTHYLVEHDRFFGSRRALYAEHGHEYGDNAERFAYLCRAGLEVPAAFGHRPAVLHLNDWQTALAAWLLRHEHAATRRWRGPARSSPSTTSPTRGPTPRSCCRRSASPGSCSGPTGVEFHDRLNLMKAGLVFADAVTTVSPTYAREITTPEGGEGLDGVLRARAGALSGILNGIDTAEWNPATDPHLRAHFDAHRLAGKAACKRALQEELGLPARPDVPLVALVGRLVDQKGIDLLLAALPELLRRDLQVAVLGSGRLDWEEALRESARHHAHRLAVRIGFDEGLAHRIEAGADLFLMPSRFEPCGLNQLYSLRYGTVPVVRRVGGLADTVEDFDGWRHGHRLRLQGLRPARPGHRGAAGAGPLPRQAGLARHDAAGDGAGPLLGAERRAVPGAVPGAGRALSRASAPGSSSSPSARADRPQGGHRGDGPGRPAHVPGVRGRARKLGARNMQNFSLLKKLGGGRGSRSC